jgi:hypothetical protein
MMTKLTTIPRCHHVRTATLSRCPTHRTKSFLVSEGVETIASLSLLTPPVDDKRDDVGFPPSMAFDKEAVVVPGTKRPSKNVYVIHFLLSLNIFVAYTIQGQAASSTGEHYSFFLFSSLMRCQQTDKRS